MNKSRIKALKTNKTYLGINTEVFWFYIPMQNMIFV